MKRAALIAGVSVAALICAPDADDGLGRVRTPTSWWSASRAASDRHRAAAKTDRIEARARQAGRRQAARPDEREGRQDAADPAGTAAHHRLDRQAARDAVRRRRAGREHGDFLGHRQPSDADGRVQRDPEEPPPRLQSLRRADALHAAHHLVGRRAARRPPARLSGLARLRPADHELRAIALEGHQDRRARHHHPRRGRAGASSSTPRLFVPRPKMAAGRRRQLGQAPPTHRHPADPAGRPSQARPPMPATDRDAPMAADVRLRAGDACQARCHLGRDRRPQPTRRQASSRPSCAAHRRTRRHAGDRTHGR